jgi:hypothetical protein
LRVSGIISMNWRGRPLTSHEVIVELIAATTTRPGLKVHAELDPGSYQLGVKVGDGELAAMPLRRHGWHGEWNDTVLPATASPPWHQACRRPQEQWWCSPVIPKMASERLQRDLLEPTLRHLDLDVVGEHLHQVLMACDKKVALVGGYAIGEHDSVLRPEPGRPVRSEHLVEAVGPRARTTGRCWMPRRAAGGDPGRPGRLVDAAPFADAAHRRGAYRASPGWGADAGQRGR